MYYYRAYELSICSSFPLPELQASFPVESPSINIKFGPVEWTLPNPAPAWKYFAREKDDFYCYWSVVGKFSIRAGKEIIIDPIAEVDVDTIRLPLLGSVLALLLYQRQQLALHASAVNINGAAVLFLGASGQGKSTTAATLYGKGHQVMTDDVAAIEFRDASTPYLLPAFPRIKLWPEAVNPALNEDPNLLKPIHPEVAKVGVSTTSSFCSQSMPIKRIYILAEGATSTAQIVPLSQQEAVSKLLENTYVPMLLSSEFSDLIDQSERFQHVCQCVNLAKAVPVCRLERPRDLALLPELASVVERDLAREIVPVER
jgi:hypothetical protein